MKIVASARATDLTGSVFVEQVIIIIIVIIFIERFQVLTAACMKMTIFWDVALCSLVEISRRFESSYCWHYQNSSETSANFYQAARRRIPGTVAFVTAVIYVCNCV
jgi:hypothetical protein